MGEVYDVKDLTSQPLVDKRGNTEISKAATTIQEITKLMETGNRFIDSIANLVAKKTENKTPAEQFPSQQEPIRQGNPVQENMQKFNPEAQIKPKLYLNIDSAVIDLLTRLHTYSEEHPGATLKETVEQLKNLNTAGILAPQVKNWMEQFITIK